METKRIFLVAIIRFHENSAESILHENLLLSGSEGTMRASDTAGGRRAAVVRGVIYRVIYSTTRTLFTYRPISDLGESRRSEQMVDG